MILCVKPMAEIYPRHH